MTFDKTTKVLLAVLALGVWATLMPQLELPEAQAGPSPAIELLAPEGQRPLNDAAEPISRTPTSTRPLRWRLAHAQEANDILGVYCMTVVQVNNTTSSEVIVDVEWFKYDGSSLGLATQPVAAQGSMGFITDDQIDPGGFQTLGNADLANFSGGYAHVNVDDPRIVATGYVVCRTNVDDAELISMTQVAAIPVGSTAEFFQAGMPPDWLPPAPHRAEPESPQ